MFPISSILDATSLVNLVEARSRADKMKKIAVAARARAGGAGISYPLDILVEEIRRVWKALPASYDNVAKILALARPIIDVVFIECGYFEPDARRSPRGQVPISLVSLMLIHLLVKVGTIRYYRQVCRELAIHSCWLKALRLDKAPHHSTLRQFRNKMGRAFFKKFFHKLAALLVAFGLVDGDAAAIIDSAPVEARMNFARANTLPRLDLARLREFFTTVDFGPALEAFLAVHPPSNRGRKPKFEPLPMIRYLVFEQLAGFLCRTKGPKYLKKHPPVATLLGFSDGQIPTTQNVAAFEARNPSLADLLQPIADQLRAFFGSEAPLDPDNHDFFF